MKDLVTNLLVFTRKFTLGTPIVAFCLGVVIATFTISGFTTFPLIGSTVNAKNRRKLAIFFGDSITQRGWDIDSDGFVASMAHWWSRKVDVINRGFSGYNSDWGLEIFHDVVISHTPDLVFIFFGANDSVDPDVPQHVPLSQYRSNIETMVQTLQKKKIAVVLITPPPVWEIDLEENNRIKGKAILKDRINDRTIMYVNTIKDIAKLYQVPYVDTFEGFEGYSENRAKYLIDGLHFNNNGNIRLYELIRNTLTNSLPIWDTANIPYHEPEWFQIIQQKKLLRKSSTFS